MPKKTREEKILARLRRLEQEQDTTSSQSGETGTKPKPQLISFQQSTRPQLDFSKPNRTVTDYSYVYSDLTKSLLFAAVAIFFQIILAIFVLK